VCRFAITLACRRLIEEFQAFVGLHTGTFVLGRDDTHRIAGWDPIDFVARPDPELFRDRFGDRHLKLAGHSGHNPYSSKDSILVNGVSGLFR